jgi:hypothetical protein
MVNVVTLRTASVSRPSPLDATTAARRKVRGPVLAIGVTAKEEAFARAVVLDGLNNTDAFRASHAADDMAAATVWRKASVVASKDRVRARMNALRADLEHQSLHDAGRVRAVVIERLHHEALNARQDGARVRALELLGKLDFVGAFRERRGGEVVDTRSTDDITTELIGRLAKLLPPS